MRKEYDFSQGKRGAVLPARGKTRITLYLDDDILETFRAHAERSGSGYQTLINRALRETLDRAPVTLDEETLRRIVREELRARHHDEDPLDQAIPA